MGFQISFIRRLLIKKKVWFIFSGVAFKRKTSFCVLGIIKGPTSFSVSKTRTYIQEVK